MRTFKSRTSTAWYWTWPISCPSSRGSFRVVSDDKQSVNCSGWCRVAAPSSDQSNPAAAPEQLVESVFGKQFPGSTGDSPVPSGNPPDETETTVRGNANCLFATRLSAVEVGGSPNWAGESPALRILKPRSEGFDAQKGGPGQGLLPASSWDNS